MKSTCRSLRKRFRSKGIDRYIFYTLTVVSLLLMLATVGLWVGGVQGRFVFVDSIYIGSKPDGCYLRHYVPLNTATNYFSREYLGFEYSRLPVIQVFKFNTVIGFNSPIGAPSEAVTLQIPHWFLTLIFAIIPTIWLFKWNKRRKLGVNICAGCGYDLTGNEYVVIATITSSLHHLNILTINLKRTKISNRYCLNIRPDIHLFFGIRRLLHRMGECRMKRFVIK